MRCFSNFFGFLLWSGQQLGQQFCLPLPIEAAERWFLWRTSRRKLRERKLSLSRSRLAWGEIPTASKLTMNFAFFPAGRCYLNATVITPAISFWTPLELCRNLNTGRVISLPVLHYGMIATGNHWVFYSLRGAPRPERGVFFLHHFLEKTLEINF